MIFAHKGKCRECGREETPLGGTIEPISARLKDLEAAGRALLEWDKRYPKDTLYSRPAAAYCQDELTALIDRFRALLEPEGES